MITLSEPDRERHIIQYCLYMESKKKRIQINLFTKQNRLTDIENKLMVVVMGGRGHMYAYS